MQIKCNHCGKAFDVVPSKVGIRKHCSKKCHSDSIRKSVSIKCEVCGINFNIRPGQVGLRKHCSRECYQQVPRDNSKLRKQIKVICQECGKIFATIPSEIKRGRGKYCSKGCLSKHVSKLFVGEGGPNWQGGRTPKNKNARDSIEYREWRNAVFARDDWTCQDCGERGVRLHPHHVFEFAEFKEHRFEVWNGVSLCVPCHGKSHPNINLFANKAFHIIQE